MTSALLSHVSFSVCSKTKFENICGDFLYRIKVKNRSSKVILQICKNLDELFLVDKHWLFMTHNENTVLKWSDQITIRKLSFSYLEGRTITHKGKWWIVHNNAHYRENLLPIIKKAKRKLYPSPMGFATCDETQIYWKLMKYFW